MPNRQNNKDEDVAAGVTEMKTYDGAAPAYLRMGPDDVEMKEIWDYFEGSIGEGNTSNNTDNS